MQHQQSAPPVSVVSLAAPADLTLLARWETHLLPLQQAGYLSFWSERHLLGGMDRLQQMQEHLEQADLIFLLVSADFFAHTECYTLMERALEQHEVRVIPLLLHPVAWQTSPLANLSVLPPDELPISLWPQPDAGFHVCIEAVCRMLGRPLPSSTGQRQSSGSGLERQNRERMLRRLRRSYTDLMSQSLGGAAWLELGLAEKPDAVQNAATLLLRVAHREEQPLPVGTAITQVYDDVEHELLIVGEPGAGKSTLLLDLAQHLVSRAERDDRHPLPIILPLSSWANTRPPLEDWLSEQLTQIYDVPRKLSEQWVREESILPLLDGLDEMQEDARPACIAAINAYHRDHLGALVVCSRTNEYEAATAQQRLALQGAVIVQPLTNENVEAALVQAGRPVAALRSALKKNPALQTLATTPLMLNVLMLTYQGTAVRELSRKEAALQQQIWTDYVARLVECKGDKKRYPLEQTRAWLSFLARQMREHNQSVFYLEHLQPDWLSPEKLQNYEWPAIRLPGIVIGILASLLIGPLFLNQIGWSLLLQWGVLGGFLAGLLSGGFPRGGSLHSQHKGHHHSFWTCIAVSIIVGLLVGLSFGLDLDRNYGLSDWIQEGWIYGIMMGLNSLLLQYLAVIASQHRLPTKKSTIRQQKLSGRLLRMVYKQQALFIAIIIGVSIGLSSGLNVGLSFGLREGLTFGLRDGIIYGFICLLAYLTCEAQAEDIHLTERLRWTWRSLTESLFTRKHTDTTLRLIYTILIITGLGYGISPDLGVPDKLKNYSFFHGILVGYSGGLGYGLSVGLAYWLLLGLFQGITHERIEDQDRRVVNQGIRDSIRNGILMGVISIGIIWVISTLGIVLIYTLSVGVGAWLDTGQGNGLSVGLYVGLSYGLREGPALGWFMGLSGGLLVCLMSGGLAVWRHYVLRFLFCRTRIFPWKASQFLDDATARILLRRVGGGYSFAHRLLLDYFADLDVGAPSDALAPHVTQQLHI